MSGGLWRNSPSDGIRGQSRQEVEHGRRERTTQARCARAVRDREGAHGGPHRLRRAFPPGEARHDGVGCELREVPGLRRGVDARPLHSAGLTPGRVPRRRRPAAPAHPQGRGRDVGAAVADLGDHRRRSGARHRRGLRVQPSAHAGGQRPGDHRRRRSEGSRRGRGQGAGRGGGRRPVASDNRLDPRDRPGPSSSTTRSRACRKSSSRSSRSRCCRRR